MFYTRIKESSMKWNQIKIHGVADIDGPDISWDFSSLCGTQTVLTCLYFNSVQFGSKLIIDGKHMAALNLLGLWLLGEDSLCRLPAGQRLQRSH